MAKKRQWGWITSGVSALAVGAIDQQLIRMAGGGKLGPLTPTQTQAGVTGLLAIGAGTTKLLTDGDGAVEHIADGTLYSSLGFLGQSGLHQVSRLIDAKAVATSTSASNPDPTSDSGLSTSADQTQDASSSSSVVSSEPSYLF